MDESKENLMYKSTSIISYSTFQEGFDHFYHTHFDYEIGLILASNGKLIIDGVQTDYHQGDIFIIGPETPHLFISDKESTNVSMAVIQFSDSFLSYFTEFKSINHWLQENKMAIKITGQRQKIARLIIQVVKHVGIDQFILLIKLLTACFNSEYNLLEKVAYKNYIVNNENTRIKLIRQWIDNNSHRPINLTDAINIIYMSKQAFCRAFKKATGKTFIDYLTEARVIQARKLLLETELAITEVAFKAGFNNISSFNRAFKYYNGKSPTNYRQHFLELLKK